MYGKETWNAFGGARGSGKSATTRWTLLLRRFIYENTNSLLFRRTLKELKLNHIDSLFTEFPALMKKYYEVTNKTLKLPNGSSILFDCAEHPGDIFHHQGIQYADILVDEGTHLSLDEIQFLMTCLRCTTNDDIEEKLILSTNPGGIGHSQIKRVFIDKKYYANEDPEDYYFLQAYGWDNIEWARKYLTTEMIRREEERLKKTLTRQEKELIPSLVWEEYYNRWTDGERFQCFVLHSKYGKRLNALPDDKRKAHLLGDWNVYAGMFFPEWNPAIHVIEDEPITKEYFNNHAWSGGLDYGQRTVLEICSADENGNIICEAECYTEYETPKERFTAIAKLLIEYEFKNLLIYYDTNMKIDFSTIVDSSKTALQIAREVFESLMGADAPILLEVSKKSETTDHFRAWANDMVKEYLHPQKEENGRVFAPRTRFRRRCTYVIDAIPKMQYDKNKPDGMDFDRKITPVDAFDAYKYALLPLISKNPQNQPQEELTDAEWAQKNIFDPILQRAMTPKVIADTL